MKRFLACAGIFSFALLHSARAVIFYATGDLNYNTSPPTGDLSGSGWQWVGNWQGYAGTPIGANFFLAAQHIGGKVGDPFVFNGVTYTTTAIFDDGSTDLRICRVSGTFPSWATIYRGNGEVGSPLVVFGFGLGRGAAVTVGGVQKGWYWQPNTAGVLRWGQNVVTSVVPNAPGWGNLLYSTFDANGGANEAQLATGDSSGPVFIGDGTEWKLAGIAAAVDGPFNTTNSGGGFNAALYDARGLYIYNGTTWELISGPTAVPSGFYATQVSVRASWIDSIVPQDNPDSDSPLLSGPQATILVVLVGAIGAASLGTRGSKPPFPLCVK